MSLRGILKYEAEEGRVALLIHSLPLLDAGAFQIARNVAVRWVKIAVVRLGGGP
jgi:hypothetical protein